MKPSVTNAKIWVYGSLMEGSFNYEPALDQGIISRTPACVRANLYHQTKKGYPAIIPGDNWVYGELLELRDFENLIVRLDEIENFTEADCDNEYNRILTATFQPETGITDEAYVYWYGRQDLNTPENPAVFIPGGDWREFTNRSASKHT